MQQDKVSIIYPSGSPLAIHKAFVALNDAFTAYSRETDLYADSVGCDLPGFVKLCEKWQRKHPRIISVECASPNNVRRILMAMRRAGVLTTTTGRGNSRAERQDFSDEFTFPEADPTEM